jgi:transcriptional regulator with XRE-family HTH domain
MTALPSIPTARWFSGAVFAAATVALQVGTGGLATGEYYRAKGDKGYAFARYDSPEKQNVTARTPTEDIARAREVLKLTVTELATVVGVSRQAVYDWLSGKPVAVDNADKLSSLGRAADTIAAEVPNPVFALRRKLAGGKTFIEFVKGGGDAEYAAVTLVSMLRRESEQRDRLQARLAARKDRKIGSAVMGVPMHNEES